MILKSRFSQASLALSRVAPLAMRIPLTIALFISILIAFIATGTVARGYFPRLMQIFGWNLPALKAGHFYSLWVGLLFASLPGVRPTALAMLLLGVGSLEYRYGTKITAIGFFLLGPLTSVLSILLLWPLDIWGIAWVRPFLYPPDMGSSSASITCWGLMLSKATGLWRNLLIGGTFIVLLLLLVFVQNTYGMDHMIAFSTGLLAGVISTWVRASAKVAHRKYTL